MTIQLGIIGAGAIGAAHAAAAKAVGVPVAAVADVNLAAAQAFAKSHGIATAVGDPNELFAMPAVQAVVIGVPNKFHHPVALAALKAGKDVLVEKPMALNRQQCQEMNDAAAANQRILQVGFVQRFSSVANTAKAYIDAGRLGNIYHTKANYYRRRGIPGLGGWFTTKALSGGGPLIDIGVHVLDLTMFLLHFPRVLRVSGKVYANFGPRMKNYLYEGMWAGPPRLDGVCDVEDAAHALLRLEGGATLELNCTWAGNFPENSVQNLIGFFGDKAGATFQLGGDSLQIASEDQGHNVDIVPKLRKVNAFEEQMRSFAHCVATREKPIATGQHGQQVQAILDAIYESSKQDREIEL